MLRNALILAVTIIIGALITYALDHRDQAPPDNAKPVSIKIADAIEQNAAAPAFEFSDLSGALHNIKDFKGKMVVLNFWASWCVPCVKEFPLFLDLIKEFPDDVVFIALSSDQDAKAMNRFLDKMREQNPNAMKQDNIVIALDENMSITRGLFQTYRLPETIIIDENGKMRAKLIGANWVYNDLKALVFN